MKLVGSAFYCTGHKIGDQAGGDLGRRFGQFDQRIWDLEQGYEFLRLEDIPMGLGVSLSMMMTSAEAGPAQGPRSKCSGPNCG